MTDVTPYFHTLTALQALIEVTEKTVSYLPAHEQEAARRRIEHARSARMSLRTWMDEQR